MAFIDLNLKQYYDSDNDDILEEFYIPVLSHAIDYYRLAGFFSSSSLYVAARGIDKLIQNEGKMKLITGAVLSKIDVKAIEEGIENPEEVIERSALNALDSLEDGIMKNHVEALSWLIAKEKLEIKIALIKNENGKILDSEAYFKKGIFHLKVGVFKDKDGNRISFSGSVNESATAWQENIEELKVFREWVEAENIHFQGDLNKFNKYWDNRSNRANVFDMPSAIKEKLIKIAPKNLEKISFYSEEQKKKNIIKPWPHQEEAIKAFKDNNYKGIFKMATGTGKTFTALLALKEYFASNSSKGFRILLIVPQQNLKVQWKEDISKVFDSKFVFTYDSSTSTKSKSIARKVWGQYKNNSENIFLIMTVDSIKNFGPFKEIKPDFIVGDEVHSYGTLRRYKMLRGSLGSVKNKLGLSATPERYYDPEGTERVVDYFGSNIFNYDIRDAQKEGVLSKYYYYPDVTSLTYEEEEEVRELTIKIGIQIARNFHHEISEKENKINYSAESLMNKRARIIKKAKGKLKILKNILIENNNKFKQCIVYCEDNEQLDEVQDIFDELNISSYIKYHSKIQAREEALHLFENKNFNYILSMHCLDQGVNLPYCESLILLSSSGNPREYIQRRGRVIRNPIGKPKLAVKIFDILAVPQNIEEMYKGLVYVQLLRAWEFIKCSETPEAKIKLENLKKSYNISDIELNKIVEEW